MIEVIFLAIALSMDAFAVSIGLGSRANNQRIALAMSCAIYFGLFQGLMPLIGYFGGKSVLGMVDAYASLIAFILLLLVGGKMIFESFSGAENAEVNKVTHRLMLVLAVATSIDAMAAGFVLNLFEVNVMVACSIIGVTTFIFSYAGVIIGTKSSEWLGSRAELFGGVVLILIGLKILFN
jgi:putative Mn2+ efflux pump MntP